MVGRMRRHVDEDTAGTATPIAGAHTGTGIENTILTAPHPPVLAPAKNAVDATGGTDIVSCFALGCPELPVRRGELQCRGLGMAVEVWDDAGHPLVGEPGDRLLFSPLPGDAYANLEKVRWTGTGERVEVTEGKLKIDVVSAL